MRRKLSLITILCLALIFAGSVFADATRWNIQAKPTEAWLSGSVGDPAWNWMKEVDQLLELGTSPGTGKIWYVDSEVTKEGTGSDWANATDTLQEAVAISYTDGGANRGDYILIAQGHEEDLIAEDAVDLLVAGITVIGLGNGTDRPNFIYTTDGEFVISVASVRIANLTFTPSTTAVAHAIDIENGGDWAIVEHCEFLLGETVNTDEFTNTIQIGTSATDVVIRWNKMVHTTTSSQCNNFVDVGAATISNPAIIGNYVYGNFQEAPIWGDSAVATEAIIAYNTLTNLEADDYAIEFTGNATGWCIGNIVSTNAVATSIDAGQMAIHANVWADYDTYDKSAIPYVGPHNGITQLNATTITAIGTEIDALTGIGMIGLCTTNAVTTTVISAQLGGYGDSTFIEGWSLMCIFDTGGAVGTLPSGEVRDVTAYTSSSGTFTTAAWTTAALTAGDYVLLTPTHLIPKDYGKTIYCDDGGSGGEATNWQNAVTTLKAAEALAAVGDTILIGESHNENIDAAEEINIAGVTVIGMGEGDTRPLLDYDSGATELTLSAAGITLRNLRFRPSATLVLKAVVVGAAGLGCTIDNCAFEVGEQSNDEFVDCISVNAAAEGLTVKNCTAWNTNATAGDSDTWLNLDGVTVDDCTAINNTVFGKFDEACIWGADAIPVNVNIRNNTLSNLTSGQLAIEFQGAATGVIANNTLYSDTYGSVLDPGSAACFGNYATNAINTSAYLVPSIDDEIAEIGPGRIFYVDSGTPGAGDGRSWGTAVATLDAGVNLCTVSARGDTIYVAAGHTETVASDFADLDVAGITVIGLGEGKSRPYFDYTTGTGSSMIINADNVTVRNLHFHANITDIAVAIEVQTTSEDVIIEDCLFTMESEGTDDFLICIDHAATNNGAVVRNCEFRLGASAATSAIHFLKADYAEISGNEISGDFSDACIHNETTASNHILIRDNQLFNGTIGGGENSEPGIELFATTSGMIVNNNIVAILDAPSEAIVALDCYLFGNKYNGLESSNGAQDIGLVAGREYSVTWSNAAYVSADMFNVAGGPILITSFFGQIGTAYNGAHTMTLWCDAGTAADDTEFTDSVDIDTYLASSLVTFSAANPGAVTEIQAGDNKGAGILMYDWYCPIGVIELLVEGNAATAGDIDYFMTFIPLTTGVTVVPQ